ncbi:MAG: SDR family NAD(P)-dependent oxidoreductase [Salinivirgaceae bacterium]|nr:SDR family NAD(P)-dependent oxidoreductase [Salinivirgaceae bacterium]MDD4746960.1 SDR family NAD(P)-dependent oxidoreductase [Salinivirgaceae bacterium]MDY0281677.1 SDR family oxidoreductase [Salinivirgaceae bacterium]
MNIVVSGCSQGIGFELVKLLGKSHNVYALSSNPSVLQVKLGQVPCSIIDFNFLTHDLSSIKNKLPDTVDILINNAGVLINKSFEDYSGDDVDKIMTVNFKIPLLLTQQLISNLRKSSVAHVVSIGSMGGFQGSSKFSGLSVYSASKAAMACLTECLATEYSDQGVRFNCLALGAVQTEMLNRAFPGYKAPLTPEEIAQYIADFALKQWRFINGKIIPVAVSNP